MRACTQEGYMKPQRQWLPSPLWISAWMRERGGRERGPAAGSWNNTRPNTRQPRATRSDFSSSVGFSERTRAAMLPVISHVTEHQSNGADGALAPAEADLQTLAGNTITQPPRPSSPMRLQERGERGGERRGRGGRVDTENSVYLFSTLFQCLRSETQTYGLSARGCRNSTLSPVVGAIEAADLLFNGAEEVHMTAVVHINRSPATFSTLSGRNMSWQPHQSCLFI